MKRKLGFTVIEMLFVIVLTITSAVLVLVQKNNAEATMRDRERKIAINAMYFQLTNVFYKQNNYYPEKISPEILNGVDPALFTDPWGTFMGDTGSNYNYQASNCEDSRCQSFKLSSIMEKEAGYIKQK